MTKRTDFGPTAARENVPAFTLAQAGPVEYGDGKSPSLGPTGVWNKGSLLSLVHDHRPLPQPPALPAQKVKSPADLMALLQEFHQAAASYVRQVDKSLTDTITKYELNLFEQFGLYLIDQLIAGNGQLTRSIYGRNNLYQRVFIFSKYSEGKKGWICREGGSDEKEEHRFEEPTLAQAIDRLAGLVQIDPMPDNYRPAGNPVKRWRLLAVLDG